MNRDLLAATVEWATSRPWPIAGLSYCNEPASYSNLTAYLSLPNHRVRGTRRQGMMMMMMKKKMKKKKMKKKKKKKRKEKEKGRGNIFIIIIIIYIIIIHSRIHSWS
jgi:hypothetical protein